MFESLYNFNQSLNNWNVENVISMSHMFFHCSHFNQSLNNWNVGNVINMCDMFLCVVLKFFANKCVDDIILLVYNCIISLISSGDKIVFFM